MVIGEVEEEGKVFEPTLPKVFKVMDGEAIRASSTRVTAVPNGPLNCLCGEG